MRIVVGYVPTPEGEAALERGIEEAKLRNAALDVLNTSKGEALVDPRFASMQQIEIVKSRLQSAGVEFELHQPLSGKEPAEEVVDLAEQVGAELIVIGLRRRSPVGKLFLGSVAQRVLLDAPCSVLAVKADAHRS